MSLSTACPASSHVQTPVKTTEKIKVETTLWISQIKPVWTLMQLYFLKEWCPYIKKADAAFTAL